MNSGEQSPEPETPKASFNLPPRPGEDKYAAARSEFRVKPPMPPPPPSVRAASQGPKVSPPPPSVRAASQGPVFARRGDPSLYTVHVDGRTDAHAKAEAAFTATPCAPAAGGF